MGAKLPILFVCASDTLVKLLMPVALKLQKDGHKIFYAKLQFTDECAEFEIAQHVPRSSYVGSVRHSESWLSNYGAIVMGNDWGREIKALIVLAQRLDIPTICVQESVINFQDHIKRMRFADYVLVQGAVSAKLLDGRNNIYITGNPRYEKLKLHPWNKTGDVLLNCNFTYGIEENNRHRWLYAAIEACEQANMSVTILQHPRDTADLLPYGKQVVRTNASTIHDQLLRGSIIVTRFSSVIHESIALGRPVIYFNPYRENVGYNFGKQCAVLKYASNTKDLQKALEEYESNPPKPEDYDEYLKMHIRPSQNIPSEECAKRIVEICDNNPIKPHQRKTKVIQAGLLFCCIVERFIALALWRL